MPSTLDAVAGDIKVIDFALRSQVASSLEHPPYAAAIPSTPSASDGGGPAAAAAARSLDIGSINVLTYATVPRLRQWHCSEQLERLRRVRGSDPERAAQDREDVQALLKQEAHHIKCVQVMYDRVRMRLLRETDIETYCKLVEQARLLESHIANLKAEHGSVQKQLSSTQGLLATIRKLLSSMFDRQ